MKSYLGLALAFGIFCMHSTGAQASCAIGDLACEKFSRKKVERTAVRRRPRHIKRRRTPKKAEPVETAAVPSVPAKIASQPATTVKTSMNHWIMAKPAAAELTMLRPGAITEAPKDLPNLVFGSIDRMEAATAKCHPVEHSLRRVSCFLAVHRLALTRDRGAGCGSSLVLRELEFARNEEGAWVNEDSISLCGGRLLRRTELVPVSLNGTPLYAVNEEFQMIGGDKLCAAPYLKSRRPLRKSYMPLATGQSHRLNCGAVATR